jgi:hypothetical protein
MALSVFLKGGEKTTAGWLANGKEKETADTHENGDGCIEVKSREIY